MKSRLIVPRCFGTSAFLLGSALFPLGCAGSSDAELDVLLEAEDTVQKGVFAGENPENIRDGWSAEFTTFAVAVGKVVVTKGGEPSITGKSKLLVDLTGIPTSGLALDTLSELDEARYDFGYEIMSAAETDEVSGVSAEDEARMREEGLSYLMRGALEKTDGVSCPPKTLAEPSEKEETGKNGAGVPCYVNPRIEFEFPVKAPVHLGPCEIDGIPGVALGGAPKTVAVTIHGDHVFFNGFPEGEGSITRLAQWLADADLNLDGRVSWEELGRLAPSDLSEFDERYHLGGAPINIYTLQDFVTAEVLSQGHFQGEGECALSLD